MNPRNPRPPNPQRRHSHSHTHVDEVEDVAPGEPPQGAGGGLAELLQDHHGDVVDHLVCLIVCFCGRGRGGMGGVYLRDRCVHIRPEIEAIKSQT